tara:strand:- start:41 stop:232 length:192 start_codon:yes stop_codon:yes gene_type:complete
MKNRNFVDNDEVICYQCGGVEFEMNRDTTLYCCVKCGAQMDAPDRRQRRPKKKQLRFKDENNI